MVAVSKSRAFQVTCAKSGASRASGRGSCRVRPTSKMAVPRPSGRCSPPSGENARPGAESSPGATFCNRNITCSGGPSP